MPIHRYFLDSHFKLHESVTLSGEEAHHLLKVTRVRAGEKVELVNGKNQLAKATTLSGATLKILEIEERAPSSPLILAQSFCRFNRLDTILEKGTELGVTEFWIFETEQSEKMHISESHQKRSERICINAMKQCGRLDLPQIITKPSLLTWDTIPLPAIFGDTDPNAPFLSEKANLIFIGPESGFSEKEEAFLKTKGVQGVKLHHNILRVDTAAIVALATCIT